MFTLILSPHLLTYLPNHLLPPSVRHNPVPIPLLRVQDTRPIQSDDPNNI